jgi:hypothetical protein
MLEALHTFFRGGDKGDDTDVERVEGASKSKGDTRPGRSTSKPRKAEMLRLADDVGLHPMLQKFLVRPDCGVRAFLCTDAATDTSKFATELEGFWKEKKQNSVFAHCVGYLRNIERRNVMDSARKCFMWLFFFDLTQHLNRLNNTMHTGSRLGPKQKANTMTFISGEFYSTVFPDQETLVSVKSQVEKWTRRGKKLDQLCEEFGEGALLILAEKLSEDM